MKVLQRPTRITANLILVAHLSAAALWWWPMPHGFPAGHPRFWANEIIPWLVMSIGLIGRIATKAKVPALATIGILWISAAITARVDFPVTFRWLWIAPFLIGVFIGIVWLIEGRLEQRSKRLPGVLSVLAGFAIGNAFVNCQQPDYPATNPSDSIVPTIAVGPIDRAVPGDLSLTSEASISPEYATIRMESRQKELQVRPLLTFLSRSPDGCWTLFAPRSAIRGPQRTLRGMTASSQGLHLSYQDDDISTLELTTNEKSRAITVEARSRLPEPVWSHLNTYTEIAFFVQGKPAISFSPCPDSPIEVTASDYPVGKPARLGYVDKKDIFHLVEARSAEKGPFRELASGALPPTAPLVLTLHDDGTPIFRITLHDWAAQAGRDLSPTAGWNLPVNAIEFSLDENSVARIYVSLAATSVGRGFDSVGHAAGVYRNRMQLEPIMNEKTPP